MFADVSKERISFIANGKLDQSFYVLCSVSHDVTFFASLLMDTTFCGVRISLSV
jgi:hypothetical protein